MAGWRPCPGRSDRHCYVLTHRSHDLHCVDTNKLALNCSFKHSLIMKYCSEVRLITFNFDHKLVYVDELRGGGDLGEGRHAQHTAEPVVVLHQARQRLHIILS